MCGIFIVDLFLTVFRRLRTRASLTGGDRLHIYDRLSDRGWSPPAVASAMGLGQVIIVTIIIMLDLWLGDWGAALTSVLVLLSAAVFAGFALSLKGVAQSDLA
jgi:hypothetical protein